MLTKISIFFPPGLCHYDDFKACDQHTCENWMTFLLCHIQTFFDQDSSVNSVNLQDHKFFGDCLNYQFARNILIVEKSLWYSSTRLGQKRQQFPKSCLMMLINVCSSVGFIDYEILYWILTSNYSDADVCNFCIRILLSSNESSVNRAESEKSKAISQILNDIPECGRHLVGLLNNDNDMINNVLAALQESLGYSLDVY
jgi:hypothetical protein